ncbi:MAG: hypothetical protein SFW36_12590 [Leptolyngbyaceae cyanobacterium bins.59]|nr:hypothetical protein [Leptolyngbyaceae cyanobacterium bins.59]
MGTGLAVGPKYQPNQRVHFVGGEGTVRGFFPNSGTWTYAVEMEMGPKPAVGRIGAETTILLMEMDLRELTE